MTTQQATCGHDRPGNCSALAKCGAQPRKAVSAPPRGSRQPMFRPFRPCLACWNGARSPSEAGIRGISVKDQSPHERPSGPDRWRISVYMNFLSRLPQSWKDLCRRSVIDFKLLPHRLSHRSEFAQVSKYLFFVGYPGSGHTLFGSLLNAHPNVIVAHELNVLKYVRIGLSAPALYHLLLQRDREFERQNRTWNGYDYSVPGQWQGSHAGIFVIGDKKGGELTVLLGQYAELLGKLRNAVRVPIKVIHYVRNPFDNITTIARRGKISLQEATSDYLLRVDINRKLRGCFGEHEWLELHHEDTIKTPAEALHKALDFLGLAGSADYVSACVSIVLPRPRRTRYDGEWTPESIETVKRRCAEVEFLS